MKTNYNDSYYSKSTTLAALPKNEWFTLKQNPNAKVYQKYDYDRSNKRYYVTDVCDVNGGRSLKGSTIVFYGFTY